MEDLQRNLRLAKYLGYRVEEPKPIGEFHGVTTYTYPKELKVNVHYGFDGKPRFYWMGLELPKDAVTMVHYDPVRSGRYPAYQWLFKKKDPEGCRKHMERRLKKMTDISEEKMRRYRESIERFMAE